MSENKLARPSKRETLAIGSSAVLAGWLGLTSSPGLAQPAPKRGGILKLALADASAQPLRPNTFGEFQSIVSSLLWDTLTIVDSQWNVGPHLAESFVANADATQWTFTLRPNVVFHDGKALTTADVAYTLGLVLDPKYGSPAFGALAGSLAPSGIEIVDERRLKLNLKRPDAFLPATIATANYGILPEGYDPTKNPGVGTGPFKIESWNAGSSFRFIRNDRYWDQPRPYFDAVEASVVPDEFTKVQAVISGAAHFCDRLSVNSLKLVENSPSVALVSSKNALVHTIDMDLTQKPFDDPRVVRAMKMIVDRQQLARLAYRSRAETTADVPLPPSSRFYPASLRDIRLPNVKEAKRLLAEAGYPNGLDLQLHTMPGSPGMVEQCVVFAELAKAAGVRVNIVQEPVATYFEKIWRKKPFFAGRWSMRHPHTLLMTGWYSTSSGNSSRFTSKVTDDALTAAAATANEAEALRQFEIALKDISENSGSIIPAISDTFFAASPRLKDIDVSPKLRFDYFRNAYFA